MAPSQVEIQFWLGEQLGWSGPGPMVLQEPIVEGESLNSLLKRLAGRIGKFEQVVYDPQTQTLLGDISLVINDQLQLPPRALDVKLKNRDRIMFLPRLCGG